MNDNIVVEKLIGVIKKVVNDMMPKKTKYPGTITAVSASGKRADVRLAGTDQIFNFLNKTHETISVGDNVMVTAIDGNLSNGYISLRFGEARELIAAIIDEETAGNGGKLSSDHSHLTNLDYKSSGHTGFASKEDIEDFIEDAPRDGNQYARENGRWVEVEASSEIDVIDNLTSTSTEDALSANQGRVIKDLIDDLQEQIDEIDTGGGSDINVIDNLESDSTTDALSANQGRILDGKIKDLDEELTDRLDEIEQELDDHLEDETRHITNEERTDWNGKADQEDLDTHINDSSVHLLEGDRERWNALGVPFKYIIGNIKWQGMVETSELWELCDGRILAREDYPDLFAVIGTHYSGANTSDGRPGFGLPNNTNMDYAYILAKEEGEFFISINEFDNNLKYSMTATGVLRSNGVIYQNV